MEFVGKPQGRSGDGRRVLTEGRKRKTRKLLIEMVGRDGIGGGPPSHATLRAAARRFIAGGTFIVPPAVPAWRVGRPFSRPTAERRP